MGCLNTKEGGGSTSEDRFNSMRKNKEIKNIQDVQATTADFVISHQDVASFSKFYKLDQNVIGEGAFGRVQKCVFRANGDERAVKIIDKAAMSQTEKVRLKYEIDILKNLIHPNIVRLYEVFEDPSTIFLVTELCDGRELFDEIIARGRFTELEAAIVCKQLLQAIAYCHEKNVAHRDLKPENVLIDSKAKGAIKVIDFGTSHVFNKDKHEMHQMYGTAYYIAPEVLSGKYDEKCDLWSIGVILYVMLSGRPPFNGRNDREILSKVQSGRYSLDDDLWDRKSDEAKNLIRSLLEVDPKKRLSASQALASPWIQKKVHSNFDADQASSALDNLKSFNAESKLKQAAITFISAQLSTKKEQSHLRQTFNLFDLNGDGKIELHEFISAYQKVYPHLEAEEVNKQATAFFEAADVDKNGNIDFGEWSAATINKRVLLNEKNLQQAFQMFDRDGGGSISAQEVAEILGHNMSKDPAVWDEIIKQVDLNGDGLIDFKEFKEMMSKFTS